MQEEISGLLDHLETGATPRESACGCGCVTIANRSGVVVCTRCDAVVEYHTDCLDGLAEKERCGPVASPLYSSVANACRAPVRMLEMDSCDRSMLTASRRIRGIQQNHTSGISAAVASVAERMFRSLLESEALKGSRREGLLEGVVFAAARSCGCARTVDEIAAMFDTQHAKVLTGIRRVHEVIDYQGPRASPREFTRRFVSRIPATAESGASMWNLVDQYSLCLDKIDIYEDEAPHVAAAAALSLAWEHTGRAGGDTVAATASGVSRSTIRKCVKKLGRERVRVFSLVSARLSAQLSEARDARPSAREREWVAGKRDNLY